jgi:hypothetical protein
MSFSMQLERNVLDESLDNECKSRLAMMKSGTLEACGDRSSRWECTLFQRVW